MSRARRAGPRQSESARQLAADATRLLAAHWRALAAAGMTEAEWRADWGLDPLMSDGELGAPVIALADAATGGRNRGYRG
jgi:hypothetical protein